MSVLHFWRAHQEELAALVGEHVLLVAISTAIAVAIGVPLGVLAARRPRLASPLVGVRNAWYRVTSPPVGPCRVYRVTPPPRGDP